MTDDTELINRARGGDGDAFRQLVERSRITTYRLAYDLTGNRDDAEDLAQETFIRAYRGLPKFRGEAKWSSWLHRITVNTFIDGQRNRRLKMVEYQDGQGGQGGQAGIEISGHDGVTARGGTSGHAHHAGPSPEKRAEAVVLRQHVDKALERLSPGERSVFVMRHFHDLPLKEIAGMLDIAEGTVKAHLFRAIRRLRKELDFLRSDIGLKGEVS